MIRKNDKILTQIHRRTAMSYEVVKKIYDKTLSYDSIFIIYNLASKYNLNPVEIANNWQLNSDESKEVS